MVGSGPVARGRPRAGARADGAGEVQSVHAAVVHAHERRFTLRFVTRRPGSTAAAKGRRPGHYVPSSSSSHVPRESAKSLATSGASVEMGANASKMEPPGRNAGWRGSVGRRTAVLRNAAGADVGRREHARRAPLALRSAKRPADDIPTKSKTCVGEGARETTKNRWQMRARAAPLVFRCFRSRRRALQLPQNASRVRGRAAR